MFVTQTWVLSSISHCHHICPQESRTTLLAENILLKSIYELMKNNNKDWASFCGIPCVFSSLGWGIISLCTGCWSLVHFRSLLQVSCFLLSYKLWIFVLWFKWISLDLWKEFYLCCSLISLKHWLIWKAKGPLLRDNVSKHNGVLTILMSYIMLNDTEGGSIYNN